MSEERQNEEHKNRVRLDQLLLNTGLVASRARARDAIQRGTVKVDGRTVTKPSLAFAESVTITIDDPAQDYVSRAALKLAAALDHFALDPTGESCVDIGASTGGFTEVLLANGASLVFAIDVGTSQLHPSLRDHPKIVSMEETDIRSYDGKRLPARPDVVVIDVSFISLKTVLPVALSLAAAPMSLLALIKPQFEADRKHNKKGIIRDAAVHQEICDDIAVFAASLGCTDIEVFPSQITGGDGNIEFFLGARRG